jgi:hypothetical protein
VQGAAGLGARRQRLLHQGDQLALAPGPVLVLLLAPVLVLVLVPVLVPVLQLDLVLVQLEAREVQVQGTGASCWVHAPCRAHALVELWPPLVLHVARQRPRPPPAGAEKRWR